MDFAFRACLAAGALSYLVTLVKAGMVLWPMDWLIALPVSAALAYVMVFLAIGAIRGDLP